jgi:hypothetical protein
MKWASIDLNHQQPQFHLCPGLQVCDRYDRIAAYLSLEPEQPFQPVR